MVLLEGPSCVEYRIKEFLIKNCLFRVVIVVKNYCELLTLILFTFMVIFGQFNF